MSRIASRAPWCVFVSATPHSGDRAAFEYLTSLGALRRSDRDLPTATERRRRRDVRGARMSCGVQPTEDEASLLAAIEAYARAIWSARGREDRAVRLIAITMARRAASSNGGDRAHPGASARAALEHDAEPAQSSAAVGGGRSIRRLEPDAMLSARGLESVDEERTALEQHDRAGAPLRPELEDSPPAAAARPSRRAGRDLHRVPRHARRRSSPRCLASARRVGCIHGGLPADQRRAAVDAFNDGRIDVLVATDAAGEGLNLHHRCRLVIDVELPWNPLRLEQRIGRVDRLGQQRTVHGIRLFHPGTIESDVLEHLRGRHQRAEDALAQPIRDTTSQRRSSKASPLDPGEPDIRSVRDRSATRRSGRLAGLRPNGCSEGMTATSGSGVDRAPRPWCRSPLVALHRDHRRQRGR